jgi:aldose 1-epimerase
VIRLRRGALALDLVPQWGGGISRLTYEGIDVLRPPLGGPGDPRPLELACFPLVPFANRVAHGRFTFGGRAVALEGNLDGQPHPLHGHGWLAPWRVEDSGEGRALLSFVHKAGAWPWPYRVTQQVELGGHGLSLALTLTNLADEPAPAGLGFHPYFPDRANARLTANLDGVWGIDTAFLPTAHHDGLPFADWRGGAALAQPSLIDHCHTGWDGSARIDLSGQGLTLRMTASADLRWLHVYSPPGEDFFCVEPVSHRPDALNAPDPLSQGVRSLGAGESMTVSMTLDVALPIKQL